MSYFDRTKTDKHFYQKYIAPRLPDKIFDCHVHINLPEHVENVGEDRIKEDWAIECGYILPCEDAYKCTEELYPDIDYYIAGFPWPIKEADIKGNNNYLALMHEEKKLFPFMSVRPEWELDFIEKVLVKGKFVGFKPYPDMVSGVKGADISIYDFIPHEQWKLLNRYQKAVMLHLPRKNRLAADGNVRELLEVRQKYPEVTIIIAHFGRSFCPYFLREGLRKMNGAEGFYFDTAAVINPEVYDIAFTQISSEKILYGSDFPILFWHGKREWTKKSYKNICREDYSWVDNHKPPEVENNYTFFVYEQMRSILDSIEKHKLSNSDKKDIFYNNAVRALKI